MELIELNQSIVVIKKEYFPLMYRFKNAHPELSFKLMDTDELIDHLSFTYKEDPIPYLIKAKGIDYTNAKKYLKLLRVCDYTKNEKLLALYNELEERFFEKDDLAAVEFKDCNIYLLELNEDIEIHSLIKRNGYSCIDLSLDDLKIEKKSTIKEHPPIIYFQNRFQQFLYLYSVLRKEVIEDPTKKDRICVLVKDSAELYYIDLFSDLFALPSYYKREQFLLSNPNVKNKVDEIYHNRCFVFNDEEMEINSLEVLHELIHNYHLDELDFDFDYANLLEILSSTTYSENSASSKGILFNSRFPFDQNQIVYVVDFEFDVFYKEYQNKNVLSDEELLKVSANPSYVLTELDERLKKNYLFYMNIALLSRVTQHLDDRIYDSQFIDDFVIEKGDDSKNNITWRHDIINAKLDSELFLDGSYTTKAKKLYLTALLDKNFYRERYEDENGDIRGYDNSYKTIKGSLPNKKETYSVTDLEKYPMCPFKYYMEKLIPDKDIDRHRMAFGTLMHKMMEHLQKPNFDFETEFENAKKDYIENMQGIFTDKEEIYLSISKHWLEIMFKTLLRENKEMAYDYPEFNASEIPVSFELKDDDGKVYPFKGKIDNILTTKSNNNRYYTIIDYKTGKEEFEAFGCFLGLSIQLPLYYFAIKNGFDDTHIDETYVFGGFGIQHTFPNSVKGAFCAKSTDVMSYKQIAKYSMAAGFISMDLDYLQSLNVETKMGLDSKKKPRLENAPTFFEPSFEYVNDVETIKLKLKKTEYEYKLPDIVKDSIYGALNSIKGIQNCDFRIAPIPKEYTSNDVSSDKVTCSFCKYKDICFHRNKDVRLTAKEIKRYFRKYEA